jgi:flagellar biosynthesis/type III secretory pathway chaperone
MRQMIKDLTGLLLEQKNLLEKLLELSREEQRILVESKPELLEDIVRRELRELSKLGAIEKKRMALHKVIASELGLPEQDLTVSAIAEYAQPDEQEVVRWLQTELTALISEHKSLNDENRELIKAHLDYTDAMLDLMVGSEDPLNNFYDDGGKAATDRKKTTGFFDGHA